MERTVQRAGLISDLFKQMEWADSVVWESILNFPPAENDLKIRNLLYHYHTTQLVYYCVWNDEPVDVPDITKFENLYSLAVWCHEYHKKVMTFIENADGGKLDWQIILPWKNMAEEKTGKPLGQTTLLDTMLQVVSHSAYHRGQINGRLRAIGGEPQLVDFIMWVWLNKPGADWSGILTPTLQQ